MSRKFDELRHEFKQIYNEKGEEARAYFVDSERAVLAGRRNVDRTTTTCRLCEATFDEDEVAKLLHLRSSHLKEWRRLVRLK